MEVVENKGGSLQRLMVGSSHWTGPAEDTAETPRPGPGRGWRRALRIAEKRGGGEVDGSRLKEKLSNCGVDRDRGCYSQ